MNPKQILKSQALVVDSRIAMGTRFTMYLYANETQARALFETAFEEVERLEETLSNYRETSELSRINRLAAQQPVTTDPEVFSLLEACLDYSRRTSGAFDVTVGPLMRAWGFFRGQGLYPTDEELRRAQESVGCRHVHLDPATRAVRFDTPGVELDLGAIGKGYAVDRVVKLLREADVEAALIDAGSSTLHAINAPPGKNGWIVHVPKPGEREQITSSVTLCNQSLSTSGSYEKFFELEGKRYSHVMDPRQGAPVQGVLQTTLVACDSTTTDALSNAMFVMGAEAGKKLLATVPHSQGLWIVDAPGSEHRVEWQWEDCRDDSTKDMPPVTVAAPKGEHTT
jgi:thiamine biosynthesis lipoprotein